MTINKQSVEKFIFITIIAFLVLHAIIKHDSITALISAICGITYTAFAGKGRPFCYLFGVCGSGFYGFLSFQSSLWGNLLLYLCYYIPMQIAGFFKWNNNLKQDKNEIVKIRLTKKEFLILVSLSILTALISSYVLLNLNDRHPYLDSFTTILSISGMYLTVRRAIEQWLFWTAVNALSFFMWLNVALSGGRVWSTVIMWAIYLFFGVYFYFEWKKELNSLNS